MGNFEIQKRTVPFYLWGGFLFAALIIIDQLIKHFVSHIFLNNRFAFSLPVPSALMYVIYFAVLAGILIYIVKNYKNFTGWIWFAWILILAGAVSNIGERIILGSVRDFIYITVFNWTGIYNLADGYIIVGIVLLLFGHTKNAKFQISNFK